MVQNPRARIGDVAAAPHCDIGQVIALPYLQDPQNKSFDRIEAREKCRWRLDYNSLEFTERQKMLLVARD
jgi:hypothetical protein